MKRIFLSLITIFAVVGVGIGVTRAYFTTTKSTTGNKITTGTIAMETNQTFDTPINFVDMKPGQTEYKNFSVTNSGTNPLNLFKEIGDISQTLMEGMEGNLAAQFKYDLSVKLYNPDSAEEPVWYQMIYDKNVTVDEIKDKNIFLGMIPVGWRMDVVQSYHFDENTDNWAQGAEMRFNMTLTGEQLKGIVVLRPKSGEPNWQILETAIGTLTYKVKDAVFDYSFEASGLDSGVEYRLIHYVDPWPGNGAGSVGLIGSGVADGSGNLSFVGTPNFNKDLINAKIWLVPSSDYDGVKMVGWAPDNYLFETGLMDYYDSVK